MWRLNIIKIIFMLIRKFNGILIKMPITFSGVLDKLITKFIWKIYKTTILKTKKAYISCLATYKKHNKSTVIENVCETFRGAMG